MKNEKGEMPCGRGGHVGISPFFLQLILLPGINVSYHLQKGVQANM